MFSRRGSLLHDLQTHIEENTEKNPLEDLIDSSLLANRRPQSLWLAK